MFVYILMLFLIFGLRYYRLFENRKDTNNDQANKRWLMFSWVILSLVQGLRSYSVGTDTGTYVNYFLSGGSGQFERGYELLNRVIRLMTNNPTIFLLVVAFLINGLVLRAIYKMSRDVSVSLFAYIALYYYFNSFNGLRQYIAIAFVLTAYTYLHENRLLPAVVFIVVAMQFHKSSVIGFMLLPMYLLQKRRKQSMCPSREPVQTIELSEPLKRFKRIALFVMVYIIFTGGFETAIRIVIRFLPQYSSYLYTEYARGTGAIQQKVVYTAILLVYLLFSEEEEWLLVMCYSVCIALLMSKIQIMSRFLWYFDIFSIFAVAEVWHSSYFDKDTLFYVQISIGLVCFAFMVYYLYAGVMRTTPYRFFFQGGLR